MGKYQVWSPPTPPEPCSRAVIVADQTDLNEDNKALLFGGEHTKGVQARIVHPFGLLEAVVLQVGVAEQAKQAVRVEVLHPSQLFSSLAISLLAGI